MLFERYCMDENEKRILDSWQMNAKLWTQAIRNQQIESTNIVLKFILIKNAICPIGIMDNPPITKNYSFIGSQIWCAL